MSLTSRAKTKLFDAIHVALDKIGTTNSTAMPATKNNREGIVWEMMVADELRRRANKRRDAAFDEAAKAGIIPDYKKSPLQPTSSTEIWKGEHTCITVKVVAKKPTLDVDAFITELYNLGVKRDLVSKAFAKCSRPNAPQHFFEAIPIVLD